LRNIPLHPRLPLGSLTIRLIGVLLVGDDFFELGKHLNPNDNAVQTNEEGRQREYTA
jgi:hypothetical protein